MTENTITPLYVAWSGKRNDTSASVGQDTMSYDLYDGDHVLYGLIWTKPDENLTPFYKAWSGRRNDTGFCVGSPHLERPLYGQHELLGYISTTPDHGATLPLWAAWSGKRNDTKLLIGDNFDTNIYNGDRALLGYIRPAGEVELIDLEYGALNYAEVVKIVPTQHLSSQLDNNSPVSQTLIATFSYSEETQSTFTWENSTTVGITVTADVEVPFLASGSIETSLENQLTIGESKTKKTVETKTYEMPVDCLPNSSCVANLVIKHGKITLPFTATLKVKGTNVSWQEKGIYSGVAFSGLDATVDGMSTSEENPNQEEKMPTRPTPTSPTNSLTLHHTQKGAASGHEEQYVNYKSWGGGNWRASIDSQGTFTHTAQGASSSHTDTIINYITWDGSEWTATIDPSRKVFKHVRKGESSGHEDTILNYLTWDGSMWTMKVQ